MLKIDIFFVRFGLFFALYGLACVRDLVKMYSIFVILLPFYGSLSRTTKLSSVYFRTKQENPINSLATHIDQ